MRLCSWLLSVQCTTNNYTRWGGENLKNNYISSQLLHTFKSLSVLVWINNESLKCQIQFIY